MATALRLQSKGLTTVLLEAHSRLGGCAGYYTRSGFSFDVGATTLVDFHREGIGGIFLDEIGLPPLDGEFLPGYMAWLPDRTIEVASDQSTWCKERLTHTGNSVRHQKFWRLFDHCSLSDWKDLNDSQYSEAKRHAIENLLSLARRVYPTLGLNAQVVELGTPRTYEAFTSRPRGAIGGIRLTMQNSNQNSVPYDIGKRGFWLVGDTTWPGLGTVACVLGSSHVSRGAFALAHKAGHRHQSS